jgi:hypothetical protein
MSAGCGVLALQKYFEVSCLGLYEQKIESFCRAVARRLSDFRMACHLRSLISREEDLTVGHQGESGAESLLGPHKP